MGMRTVGLLLAWAALGRGFLHPGPHRPSSTQPAAAPPAHASSSSWSPRRLQATALAAASDSSTTSSGSKVPQASRPKPNATLLNDLKPGLKLHGGVVGVTDFAAFLDTNVVRKGPGGRLVRCNAMLHPHDVPEGYKLLRDGHPLPLESDPHVIRRGIHATVFVKDVFPNSGRFSVTLDPTINKGKVIEARMQKRAQGKKRNKTQKLAQDVEPGTEREASVVKLLRRGLLLDAGLPVPVFLAHTAIPEGISLADVRKVGQRLAVRVSEKTDKQVKTELLKVL